MTHEEKILNLMMEGLTKEEAENSWAIRNWDKALLIQRKLEESLT